MVQNMAGFNVRHFRFFDAFLFSGVARPIQNIYVFSNLKRKFKAVLGDKSVTSGKGKGR